jgi:ketosteroid isomerase-like protein
LLNERLLNELSGERNRHMPPATPADVLSRRRQLMLNMDTDGFADLFAPDAVMEFAFHGPPGTPPVRLAGREAVIAEMRTAATVTTTGRSITATSIQVLRIQDGHIVLFRDFADPRIFQDVTGAARAGG